MVKPNQNHTAYPNNLPSIEDKWAQEKQIEWTHTQTGLKCTTQHMQYSKSQHGLRVRPGILASIYDRFLGSNLRFQKLEKISEGGELRVRPTYSSASCYRVMVNYPGFMYRHNISLLSQTRQRNSQYLWNGVPACIYFVCIPVYCIFIVFSSRYVDILSCHWHAYFVVELKEC